MLLAQTAFWTRVRLPITPRLLPNVSPGVPLEDTRMQVLSMESNVSARTPLNLAQSKRQNPNAQSRVLENLMRNVGMVIA